MKRASPRAAGSAPCHGAADVANAAVNTRDVAADAHQLKATSARAVWIFEWVPRIMRHPVEPPAVASHT